MDLLGQLDRSMPRAAAGAVILGIHVLVVALAARAHWQPASTFEAAELAVSVVQPEVLQRPAAPLAAPRLTMIQAAAVQPEVTVQLPPAPAAVTVTDAASSPPSAIPGNGDSGVGPIIVSEVAYLRQPQPHYPPESRHQHEEGLVILRVLIDINGRVAQVSVAHSSGHPRLDAAACEAVAGALFKPHLAGGVPHEALATVPVEFSLHRA